KSNNKARSGFTKLEEVFVVKKPSKTLRKSV
ncbi:unnamed protein product, partial [marine sediment metagenome]